MPATIERFPSVPQFRPFLKKILCGTDGRGLKYPLPPSVSEEAGTNTERTGTDGNGRAKVPPVPFLYGARRAARLHLQTRSRRT